MQFDLPKWPQMRVIGKPIAPNYALEIIRRTDTFFSLYPNGNNKEWVNFVERAIGYPRETAHEETRKYWQDLEDWADAWGAVSTEYVRNCWVSSSFIGGPHGWCHPDGTIYFADNVGKWPSSEELVEEWTKIAQAFPGLHLDAMFMNGESSEDNTQLVFAILVRDQEIHVHGAEQYELYWEAFGRHEYDEAWQAGETQDARLARILDFNNPMREIGISEEQIIRWATEFIAKHPQYAK